MLISVFGSLYAYETRFSMTRSGSGATRDAELVSCVVIMSVQRAFQHNALMPATWFQCRTTIALSHSIRRPIEDSQASVLEIFGYFLPRKILSSIGAAMKKQLQSDEIIESLVDASLSECADIRQKFLYTEALRSLVRLAKSEQVIEIKTNVRRLTGALESTSARRRAKAVLLAQRLPGILDQVQRQLEFK